MAAGQLLDVLYCKSIGNSGTSIAPCVTIGTTRYVPKTITAYVLDPASASAIDAVAAPINYVDLGLLWGFGFSLTIMLWFLSKNLGALIKAVREY